MGDAEIIPIGTRGRPGRGQGGTTPSSASRSLAGGATRTPRPLKASRVNAGVGPDPEADAVPVLAPVARTGPRHGRSGSGPGTTTGTTTGTDATSAAVPGLGVLPGVDPDGSAPPTSDDNRSAVRTEDRGAGIPVGDWLMAFTRASRELFGESWEPQLARFLAFLRRRLTGDYQVDEYGFDQEITEQFFVAALRPLAEKWFRIDVRGIDNIPAEGGALVVSNHSGTLPVDGLMTMVVVHDHAGRNLRPLGADLVFRTPLVAALARRTGATLACAEDAERLLRGGELVGVWPEGFKGVGKPYSERYKLQRFGRGGFVSAALRTGVPIIPLSVVGAEEIYPLVGNLPSLARFLGVPYLPITPFFPWLGPLGAIPLPSKWLLEFGEPIRTDELEPGAADDPMLVFDVTDQVRETIQSTLYSLLMQRQSVFG